MSDLSNLGVALGVGTPVGDAGALPRSISEHKNEAGETQIALAQPIEMIATSTAFPRRMASRCARLPSIMPARADWYWGTCHRAWHAPDNDPENTATSTPSSIWKRRLST